MDIVQGSDRCTQAYAQIIAWHWSGLASLDFIIGASGNKECRNGRSMGCRFFVPSVAFADVTFACVVYTRAQTYTYYFTTQGELRGGTRAVFIFWALALQVTYALRGSLFFLYLEVFRSHACA